MAKIERIGFDPKAPNDPELQTDIINVSAAVGANGVNYKDDVIVVQALLKYSLERHPKFKDVELPEPTGAFIGATARLIKKYQRYQTRDGQDVAIDGRIDPIKGGVFAYGTKKWWTLYALNVEAIRPTILEGHTSPIKAICDRWSIVKTILEKNGVGSLNLALE
jgi:hypothetical protein